MRIHRIGTILLASILSHLAALAAEEAPKPMVIDSAPPRLRGIRPQLMSTTFSPDGKLLVTTAGWPFIEAQEPGELTVWDLATRAPKLIVRQEKTIRSAAFSPDGKLLAMCDFGGNTVILDPTSGRTIVALPRRTTLVNMVQFSADGKWLFACGFDGQIVLWDVARRLIAATLKAPDQRLVTITATRDGKHLAASSQEGHSFVWNLPRRELLYSVPSSPIRADNPRDTETVAFSPDGQMFATGSYDSSVILWDRADGRHVRSFYGHASQVCKVVFSPDGSRLYTSDYTGKIMLWDAQTGAMLAKKTPHTRPCYAMSISPDGKMLATGGFDWTVKLLDASTLQTLAVLEDGK